GGCLSCTGAVARGGCGPQRPVILSRAAPTAQVLIAELPYVTLLLRVRGNTDTERRALERRRDFDHQVAGLLQAAAAEGDVRADVEVRLATRLVFGMINSVVEWYRPDGRGASEREVADAVVRLAFGGLRRDG
ncbi:hypothetical protein ACFW2E_03445, partial [Streptomyces sp. NPDC058964]